MPPESVGKKKQKKYSILLRLLLISGVVFLVSVAVGLFGVLWARDFLSSVGVTPAVMYNLLFNGRDVLRSSSGRTNILLLGIGGVTHEGSQLTDTMMVMSYSANDRSIGLVSVPRDIWSETLKDKINSAFYYGEQREEGGGRKLAQEIVEEVVGLPMHYVLLVDFSGFEKIIDIVGGITVDVETGFTDPKFPIAGKEADPCDGDPQLRCRYTSLTFASGPQHMDGETALSYVRSRHARGDEGTDFARGKRQQEVILALRNKLMNPATWWPPEKVKRLYEAFVATVQTEMSITELLTMGKLVARTSNERIERINLAGELKVGPASRYGGRYVLVPKMSIKTIHNFVMQELEGR